jgi:hypothetical protein
MASIKCAHCHGYHSSVGEVKNCSRGTVATVQPAPVATVAQSHLPGRVGQYGFVTRRQYDYLVDLGADRASAAWLTFYNAKGEIDRLKREQRKMSETHTTPEHRLQTIIPMDYLLKLRDGYYASRPDDTQSYTFFRVSRPNRGKYKGALKIQTQHGPELKLYMVVWDEERVYKYSDFSKYENDLLLVTVDMRGCAMEYAKVIGHCMRCNTELTDDRSRWYGIGPECEKHWPEIIDEINDIKGVFKYGSGN